MKINTHTHVTLNQQEIREIIAKYIRSQGFLVEEENINFLINQGGLHESAKLTSCTAVCGITERQKNE